MIIDAGSRVAMRKTGLEPRVSYVQLLSTQFISAMEIHGKQHPSPTLSLPHDTGRS